MTDPTKLRRVLSSCEQPGQSDVQSMQLRMADAARLLRLAVDDFHEYGNHGVRCPQPGGLKPCDCGFLKAQERWRLE